MKIEDNKNEIAINVNEEMKAELKMVIDYKLPKLHLPNNGEKQLKKELNAFVLTNSDNILSGIKEISRQMDMIINYITMRQSAIKDKDVQINIEQLSEKMYKSLENIHKILQGDMIEVEDDANPITVHRTNGILQ